MIILRFIFAWSWVTPKIGIIFVAWVFLNPDKRKNYFISLAQDSPMVNWIDEYASTLNPIEILHKSPNGPT
jgi:hypothetical protein